MSEDLLRMQTGGNNDSEGDDKNPMRISELVRENRGAENRMPLCPITGSVLNMQPYASESGSPISCNSSIITSQNYPDDDLFASFTAPEKRNLQIKNNIRRRFAWTDDEIHTRQWRDAILEDACNWNKDFEFWEGKDTDYFQLCNANYNGNGKQTPRIPKIKYHENTVQGASPCATTTQKRALPIVSQSSSSCNITPPKSLSKFHKWNGDKFTPRVSARRPGFLEKSVGAPSTLDSFANFTRDAPYFELKEDPSFWNDHNIQVLVRIRPLNQAEITSNDHHRCLRQENSCSVTCLGSPERRFIFDHVACEVIDQEMLFKVAGFPIVENCLAGYNSCMFAYGQTGSGKTYTMMGNVEDLDCRPRQGRGMTPRIFEHLFTRMKEEEDRHQEDQLKYICRCSFLEIYNEQITDLLEPSSTFLQLREDVRRGVYVENLTEFEVTNVQEVMQLLIVGSSNRKVAATEMNRESSRSHSVFTCVVESQREANATTNTRYARLNLVDLAGSERSKMTGTEGVRLKEASCINKSLCTLGLVVMALEDRVKGKNKQRHVPYRDSKLTFLLQDSLGGNSKTTIIANVSPSISSAKETLSTLSFAQGAKNIQNKAFVNNDSSVDVMALQQEIQQLKEELRLLKRDTVPKSTVHPKINVIMNNQGTVTVFPTNNQPNSELEPSHNAFALETPKTSGHKINLLQATLVGAFRREKVAENMVKRYEAVIQKLNHLVGQREEETRCMKMLLRFKEENIKRLEDVKSGILPPNEYFHEQRSAMDRESQLIQNSISQNPEVTRFAMENLRLIEQLRSLEEFYGGGEREALLSEISDLCDQLTEALERNHQPEDNSHGFALIKVDRAHHTTSSNENKKLTREMEHLQSRNKDLEIICKQQEEDIKEMDSWRSDSMQLSCPREQDPVVGISEEFTQLQAQIEMLQSILEEEREFRKEAEERATMLTQELENATNIYMKLNTDLEKAVAKLEEAKPVRDALELENLSLTKEFEKLQERNKEFDEWEKAAEKLASYIYQRDYVLEDGLQPDSFLSDALPGRGNKYIECIDKVLEKMTEQAAMINCLQRHLEHERKPGCTKEGKSRFIRDAVVTMVGAQKQNYNDITREAFKIKAELVQKISAIQKMEIVIDFYRRCLKEANKRALTVCIVLNNQASTQNIERKGHDEALVI